MEPEQHNDLEMINDYLEQVMKSASKKTKELGGRMIRLFVQDGFAMGPVADFFINEGILCSGMLEPDTLRFFHNKKGYCILVKTDAINLLGVPLEIQHSYHGALFHRHDVKMEKALQVLMAKEDAWREHNGMESIGILKLLEPVQYLGD